MPRKVCTGVVGLGEVLERAKCVREVAVCTGFVGLGELDAAVDGHVQERPQQQPRRLCCRRCRRSS